MNGHKGHKGALAIATVLMAACAGACVVTVGGRPKQQQKKYVIMTKYGETKDRYEIKADRISENNGCVLFWRGEVLDSMFCERMASVIVTEEDN